MRYVERYSNSYKVRLPTARPPTLSGAPYAIDLATLCHSKPHLSHDSDDAPEIQTTCDPGRDLLRLQEARSSWYTGQSSNADNIEE